MSPGDLVMARWRGYKTFFRGRVLKVFRPKTQIEQEMLDIEYDDGQLEVNMSCERLCLLCDSDTCQTKCMYTQLWNAAFVCVT